MEDVCPYFPRKLDPLGARAGKREESVCTLSGDPKDGARVRVKSNCPGPFRSAPVFSGWTCVGQRCTIPVPGRGSDLPDPPCARRERFVEWWFVTEPTR